MLVTKFEVILHLKIFYLAVWLSLRPVAEILLLFVVTFGVLSLVTSSRTDFCISFYMIIAAPDVFI